MTIAIVHNKCTPYRKFLFEELANRFDIEYLFFNQKGSDIPDNCKYEILKGIQIPKLSDYWIVQGLKKRLFSKKYDLILGGDLGAYNTKIAFQVAQKTNTPFIPWILEWDRIKHPRRQLRKRFETKLLKKSSAIVCPGVNHRKYLISRGADTSKLHYIPNCKTVDPPKINQNHPLYKVVEKLKNKHRIICSIGRHVPFKGHEQLIRAQSIIEKTAKKNAPFLIIAGDGPLLNKNMLLAEQLGLKKIMFVDHFVNVMEKDILLDFTDIFILPSKRTNAFEAWGLVCNEAAFAGKPMIISSAVGCKGEVVRHGENGYIFEDQDIQELTDYVLKLCDNDQLIRRFSMRSKKLYESYTPEVMIEGFSKMFYGFIS